MLKKKGKKTTKEKSAKGGKKEASAKKSDLVGAGDREFSDSRPSSKQLAPSVGASADGDRRQIDPEEEVYSPDEDFNGDEEEDEAEEDAPSPPPS